MSSKYNVKKNLVFYMILGEFSTYYKKSGFRKLVDYAINSLTVAFLISCAICPWMFRERQLRGYVNGRESTFKWKYVRKKSGYRVIEIQ